jgi:hypothetical protein
MTARWVNTELFIGAILAIRSEVTQHRVVKGEGVITQKRADDNQRVFIWGAQMALLYIYSGQMASVSGVVPVQNWRSVGVGAKQQWFVFALLTPASPVTLQKSVDDVTLSADLIVRVPGR